MFAVDLTKHDIDSHSNTSVSLTAQLSSLGNKRQTEYGAGKKFLNHSSMASFKTAAISPEQMIRASQMKIPSNGPRLTHIKRGGGLNGSTSEVSEVPPFAWMFMSLIIDSDTYSASQCAKDARYLSTDFEAASPTQNTFIYRSLPFSDGTTETPQSTRNVSSLICILPLVSSGTRR